MRVMPLSTIGLSRGTLWTAYAGFWFVVGLLLAIAELQQYMRFGGRHVWEPFLWELSSTATVGLLVIGIFRWHARLAAHFSWPSCIAGHAVGLAAYVLLHCAGMYGIRAVIYAWAAMTYEPGHWQHVLAYEGAKDTVSYMLMVLLSHGLLLFMREQQRASEWQQLQTELAQMRLARLQEQVQPHFLFNTLNLVSSVMYDDVERADRILSDLADLLRLTLEAGRTSTHSMQAELALVAPFLSIMQQRFADRLSVHVDVSEEAKRCQIPTLLLISPLENAVKHGVAQSIEPTNVRVTAEVHEATLELTVANSAGQLQRDQRPGGLGLPNTRERLAALFGESTSVALSRENGTTVLRMRLPARLAA